MKKYVFEFLKRGICAMGFGPLVLAAVWGILYACGVLEVLTGVQVVFGIVGISLLVFVAAGITVVYQIDKLPLLYAMLIHGVTLYIDYAAIYLVNGWLKEGIMPFIIFTIIFVAGYALIWGIVYLFIRKDIEKINRKIRKG
ncbi:MAG: DUF3021 domain-containing protein [Clostridia bacterium]|nr:DUF3021 domain-containing protein [Clostridia bacterium]